MDSLIEKLPDIAEADGFDLPGSDARRLRSADMDDIDHERLTGSGLRALREFLKKEDPNEQWGGLKRVLTPEGDYLWLCDKHAKVYYSK